MPSKSNSLYDFSPSVEQLKITAVLTETVKKLHLLSKINLAHDNSSELAGFEINKLLKEQSRLESSYNSLINQKSKLKGILHKPQFDKVNAEIRDTSLSLKECTKKLSRLFKENKNLAEDVLKVNSERQDAMQLLQDFSSSLEQQGFYGFEDGVLEELQGHNKLEEFQIKEKGLLRKIKKLRQELSLELKNYQNEVDGKQGAVEKLKDELQKQQTASDVKIRFQVKELEAEESSEKRLYSQEQECMLADKKSLEEEIKREGAVAGRNNTYLLDQKEILADKLEEARVG